MYVFVMIEYTQKRCNVSYTARKQFKSCSDFCIWNAAFVVYDGLEFSLNLE